MPGWQLLKDIAFWAPVLYATFYSGGAFTRKKIESQKTISSYPVHAPVCTSDFHLTKVEAPPSYRNSYSSKAIPDNFLSNPPIYTINTRLDDISSIYTAPDATYFCTGTETDPHYFQSRPADDSTLIRLIEHQPVVWEAVLTSTVITQVVYEDREQIDHGRTPSLGTTLIDWGFNHWILSAGMILFCLNFRYKWVARWLAQEQRHQRERQQMQQQHRDQITSKYEDYFRMVVELDMFHKQAFDELKEKHDQKIIEKDVRSSRGFDELKAKHNRVISETEAKAKCRTARLYSKVQELEKEIIYKDNAHHHKQGVTRDFFLEKAKDLEEKQAGERKRLGQLPENYTERLKENHASELDFVKQLHEQELSHKDTQLQEAKSNHKRAIEAKEKETKSQIKKKDEEVNAKTQQITASNLKATKAITEKKDEIKALRKDLEISDATAQTYKTANRTATRSLQKRTRRSDISMARSSIMNAVRE